MGYRTRERIGFISRDTRGGIYRTRERGIWFIARDTQGDKELGRGGYGLYLEIPREIKN